MESRIDDGHRSFLAVFGCFYSVFGPDIRNKLIFSPNSLLVLFVFSIVSPGMDSDEDWLIGNL